MGLGHGICVVGKAMSGLDIERLNLGLGCNAGIGLQCGTQEKAAARYESERQR